MGTGVLAMVVSLVLGSQTGSRLGGSLYMGIFSLGLAVFSTLCVFAPKKTLSHPTIVATIGTNNPLLARVACGIAAVLFGFVACAVFFGGL